MTRCRYINDYVLYEKGNLDTATAIQGFVTWRVEEVKNMIEWMKEYNASVPEEKKVKFFGYDLQINDNGWKELNKFYSTVNAEKLPHLDSLNVQLDSASAWSNNTNRQPEGAALFKTVYQQCLEVLNDIVFNEGQYQYMVGKKMYDENLMNLKLIVQEAESYKAGFNNLRDYFMAQNILYLLNQEKPDAKVMVWAHNGHIAKSTGTMGGYLANTLKDKYYAIGFEFYSGSFQTRNIDINNKSANWDIMTVGIPPDKSLAWYMNITGKDKFFLDFRNTGTDEIKNFSKEYDMHSFGSMYSTKWPVTYPSALKNFDGLIFIKNSTAAKNFTKVYLRQ
jgi:erythromycin esterase